MRKKRGFSYKALKLEFRLSRGVTLIELLISIVIVGIMGSGIAASIGQLIQLNMRAANHLEAVKQVERTVYYFSRNSQMIQQIMLRHADNTKITDENPPGTINYDLLTGDKVEFSYVDWDMTSYRLIYTYNGGLLQQYQEVNHMGSITGIDSNCTRLDGSWTSSNKTLTLTVECTVGTGTNQATEIREIKIIPRPGF